MIVVTNEGIFFFQPTDLFNNSNPDSDTPHGDLLRSSTDGIGWMALWRGMSLVVFATLTKPGPTNTHKFTGNPRHECPAQVIPSNSPTRSQKRKAGPPAEEARERNRRKQLKSQHTLRSRRASKTGYKRDINRID
jgi:hypothetical protein